MQFPFDPPHPGPGASPEERAIYGLRMDLREAQRQEKQRRSHETQVQIGVTLGAIHGLAAASREARGVAPVVKPQYWWDGFLAGVVRWLGPMTVCYMLSGQKFVSVLGGLTISLVVAAFFWLCEEMTVGFLLFFIVVLTVAVGGLTIPWVQGWGEFEGCVFTSFALTALCYYGAFLLADVLEILS